MRVGNDPGLITDGVEDILDGQRTIRRGGEGELSESTYLHTALAQELVSGSEGDLDDGSKLGKLLGGVGLDVGNALEVG